MNGSPYGPYNPYNPYFDPVLYERAQGEKHQLKQTANGLCITLLASMLFVYVVAILGNVYLKGIGYTPDYTNPDFSGYTPVLYYLREGIVYLLGLTMPALLYLAIRHIPLREVLPFQKTGFLKTGAFVFFGVAVCMLANFPANIVANIEKAFGFNPDLSLPLTNDPAVLALYFITLAVAPPIVEELIFRGIILQSFRRFGDGFAVVASAMLFGLFHGNFVQMIFAFIAGLVMALAVVRTNSLLPSILIHFCNNSISFAITATQRLYGDTAVTYVNNAVFGVSIILGIGSLFYLWSKDRHLFQGDAGNPMFRLPAKIKALFFNFGGVCMLIYAFASSLWVLTK